MVGFVGAVGSAAGERPGGDTVELDQVDVDQRFAEMVTMLAPERPHLWAMRAAAAITGGAGLVLTPAVAASGLTGTHWIGLAVLFVAWSTVVLAAALGAAVVAGGRRGR